MIEGLFLAVVLILCITAIFTIPFKILEWMNEIIIERGSPIQKFFLFIPWLIMVAFCLVLEIIATIWNVITLVTGANAARDWWHKGKK